MLLSRLKVSANLTSFKKAGKRSAVVKVYPNLASEYLVFDLDFETRLIKKGKDMTCRVPTFFNRRIYARRPCGFDTIYFEMSDIFHDHFCKSFSQRTLHPIHIGKNTAVQYIPFTSRDFLV